MSALDSKSFPSFSPPAPVPLPLFLPPTCIQGLPCFPHVGGQKVELDLIPVEEELQRRGRVLGNKRQHKGGSSIGAKPLRACRIVADGGGQGQEGGKGVVDVEEPKVGAGVREGVNYRWSRPGWDLKEREE